LIRHQNIGKLGAIVCPDLPVNFTDMGLNRIFRHIQSDCKPGVVLTLDNSVDDIGFPFGMLQIPVCQGVQPDGEAQRLCKICVPIGLLILM
jgi:hypothetical protein